MAGDTTHSLRNMPRLSPGMIGQPLPCWWTRRPGGALAAALTVTDGITAARARMMASGLIENTENSGGSGV